MYTQANYINPSISLVRSEVFLSTYMYRTRSTLAGVCKVGSRFEEGVGESKVLETGVVASLRTHFTVLFFLSF
jgi:hypothetical protein